MSLSSKTKNLLQSECAGLEEFVINLEQRIGQHERDVLRMKKEIKEKLERILEIQTDLKE